MRFACSGLSTDILSCQGTGHYLSPGGGGEAEDSRGNHLIFGRTKGGISSN